MSIYIKSFIALSSLCILTLGTTMAQEKKMPISNTPKTKETYSPPPSINVSEVKPTEHNSTTKKATFKAVGKEVKTDTTNVNHKFKSTQETPKK